MVSTGSREHPLSLDQVRPPSLPPSLRRRSGQLIPKVPSRSEPLRLRPSIPLQQRPLSFPSRSAHPDPAHHPSRQHCRFSPQLPSASRRSCRSSAPSTSAVPLPPSAPAAATTAEPHVRLVDAERRSSSSSAANTVDLLPRRREHTSAPGPSSSRDDPERETYWSDFTVAATLDRRSLLGSSRRSSFAARSSRLRSGRYSARHRSNSDHSCPSRSATAAAATCAFLPSSPLRLRKGESLFSRRFVRLCVSRSRRSAATEARQRDPGSSISECSSSQRRADQELVLPLARVVSPR